MELFMHADFGVGLLSGRQKLVNLYLALQGPHDIIVIFRFYFGEEAPENGEPLVLDISGHLVWMFVCSFGNVAYSRIQRSVKNVKMNCPSLEKNCIMWRFEACLNYCMMICIDITILTLTTHWSP
jgi:hypothetical protein